QPGVGHLLARRVEARGQEGRVQRLPLARRLAGVDPRRHALVEVAVARHQFGPRVDAAAAVAGEGLLAVAVEYLDLVEAHELDAGVGALGDEELDVNLDVAEGLFADEVTGAAPGEVDDDALAGGGGEPARRLGVERDALGMRPA